MMWGNLDTVGYYLSNNSDNAVRYLFSINKNNWYCVSL